MQLFFTHLPDEHLEQAANHKQCIVGLPDKQLTAEEKQKKDNVFKVKHNTALFFSGNAGHEGAGYMLLVYVLNLFIKIKVFHYVKSMNPLCISVKQ